ncbi:hypothetical protein THOG05_10147 [Vibrio rotiferianus]|nr:hypothetical protein THOG05_10147 [Vibrio rotiferianus]
MAEEHKLTATINSTSFYKLGVMVPMQISTVKPDHNQFIQPIYICKAGVILIH